MKPGQITIDSVKFGQVRKTANELFYEFNGIENSVALKELIIKNLKTT